MPNLETGPADTQGNTYISQYTNYQLDEDELRTQLTRRDTQMAIALNYKTNGIYDRVEVQTGEQFFGDTGSQQKKRLSFRKVFPFTGAATTITHGITGLSQLTHIYGTAIGTVAGVTRYIPLPYVSATLVTDQIQIYVTATQILIVYGGTAPTVTSGIIVLEYLKN